jgi:hypothetical protein
MMRSGRLSHIIYPSEEDFFLILVDGLVFSVLGTAKRSKVMPLGSRLSFGYILSYEKVRYDTNNTDSKQLCWW